TAADPLIEQKSGAITAEISLRGFPCTAAERPVAVTAPYRLLQRSPADVSGKNAGTIADAKLVDKNGQRIGLFSGGASCAPGLENSVRRMAGEEFRNHPLPNQVEMVRIAKEVGFCNRQFRHEAVQNLMAGE